MSFGELLAHHILQAGLTPNAFATHVGMASATLVYKLLDDERPPPPKYVRAMADHLALRGHKRTGFLLQAAFAHLSKPSRDLILSVRRDGSSDAEILAALLAALTRSNPPTPRRVKRRR